MGSRRTEKQNDERLVRKQSLSKGERERGRTVGASLGYLRRLVGVEIVSDVNGGAALERLGSEEGVGREVRLDRLRSSLRRSLSRRKGQRRLDGGDGGVMRRLRRRWKARSVRPDE